MVWVSSDRTRDRVCGDTGLTQSFTDKPISKTAQQPLIGSVCISPVEGHWFMGFWSSELDGSDPPSTRSGYWQS